MSTNRISAEHTAKAILVNLAMYGETKGKELSRFRISKKSVKVAANRLALRESFVIEVIDEMAQLGWSCINTDTMASEGELAFIQTDKIDVWPRLGVIRIRPIVRAKTSLEKIEANIDEHYEQYYPEHEEEDFVLED